MTTTVTIEEAQIRLKGLLALAREGDEILIEDNGEEVGKIIPIVKKPVIKERLFGGGIKKLGLREAGLGRGSTWMSDDFNDELPDEFWGFDRDEI
jgi:prevent-host-death family protein